MCSECELMKLSPVANINRRFNSGHVRRPRDSRSLATKFRFAANGAIRSNVIGKSTAQRIRGRRRGLKEEADFVM